MIITTMYGLTRDSYVIDGRKGGLFLFPTQCLLRVVTVHLGFTCVHPLSAPHPHKHRIVLQTSECLYK